jgi:hypothetical protein
MLVKADVAEPKVPQKIEIKRAGHDAAMVQEAPYRIIRVSSISVYRFRMLH